MVSEGADKLSENDELEGDYSQADLTVLTNFAGV